MKKKKMTKVIETPINEVVNDLACGNCFSYLYGYDEVMCPCCGCLIDMDHPIRMTEDELVKKYEKFWEKGD